MDDTDLQSGALIGSNDDLLTEILIRLPATSILRFKSVCKHWRLLLSHKHFTHRYDNNSLSKSPIGVFGHGNLNYPYEPLAKSLYVPFDVANPDTPLSSTRLDDYFNRSNVVIMQSCNGLLLCSAPHNGAREYYVFNPTTKQMAIIPSTQKNIWTMALAYHHTHCAHYKVVCICSFEPYGDLFQIQVYSSDTKKWKIFIESFSVHERPVFRNLVYWNGAMYWTPGSDHNLLYFKLDVEELQMMALPPEMMTYESHIRYFGESRGHLHVIYRTEEEKYLLHVYEMLTDHSGWFVKYQLEFDRLLRDCPCLFFPYKRVGVFGKGEHIYHSFFEVVDAVRGKEEEDSFLVLLTFKNMIKYNVHDKSFMELYRSNSYSLHPSRCHPYIETLSAF